MLNYQRVHPYIPFKPTKVGQLNCETHCQEASRCVADISCSGNYTLRSWWRGWGMAMTMTTIRTMMIIMIMIIMMWWWWWCGDITSNPIDDQHFDIWVYMGYILPNLPTTNMTTLPWLGFFSWGVCFFSKSAGKLGWRFYQQAIVTRRLYVASHTEPLSGIYVGITSGITLGIH